MAVGDIFLNGGCWKKIDGTWRPTWNDPCNHVFEYPDPPIGRGDVGPFDLPDIVGCVDETGALKYSGPFGSDGITIDGDGCVVKKESVFHIGSGNVPKLNAGWFTFYAEFCCNKLVYCNWPDGLQEFIQVTISGVTMRPNEDDPLPDVNGTYILQNDCLRLQKSDVWLDAYTGTGNQYETWAYTSTTDPEFLLWVYFPVVNGVVQPTRINLGCGGIVFVQWGDEACGKPTSLTNYISCPEDMDDLYYLYSGCGGTATIDWNP